MVSTTVRVQAGHLLLRHAGGDHPVFQSTLDDPPFPIVVDPTHIADRSGFHQTWQVLIAVYTLAGLFGAIAGLLLGGRVGAVDLQLANVFLLPSVAAAVIGGTSIFGGVGTYSGTILGALILGVLQSLLTFLGAGQAIQQMLYGSIVIGLSWLYTRIAAAQ